MFRLTFIAWWLLLLFVAVPSAFTAGSPVLVFSTIAALLATIVYSFINRKTI